MLRLGLHENPTNATTLRFLCSRLVILRFILLLFHLLLYYVDVSFVCDCSKVLSIKYRTKVPQLVNT